jgi:DNA polymerase-3 subunit beta
VLIECRNRISGLRQLTWKSARGEFEGEILKEGTITVSAKKLYEIIREVPTEEVQLKRLENDWVEIKSGKSVLRLSG